MKTSFVILPLLIDLGIGSHVLRAQSSNAHPSSAEQLAVVQSASIATIESSSKETILDTGDFRYGRTNVAAYTTPGMCRAAVEMETRRDVRTLAAQAARDTIGLHPERDPLSDRIKAFAIRCGARFTADNTTATDRPDLFVLRLMMGDDAGARAIADAQLASVSSPSMASDVLMAVVQGYLEARPVRIAEAKTIIARSERSIPLKYGKILPVYAKLLEFAIRYADTTLQRRTAEHIRDMAASLVDSVRRRNESILTRANDVLQQNAGDDPSAGAPGTTAALLHPARWMYADARDTLVPRRGVVSVVVNLPSWCFWGGDDSRCVSLVRTIRRWRETYGTDQLAFALQSWLLGFSLPRRKGVQPLDEEAHDQWSYVHDYLQLPGALALRPISYTMRPQPDGRRSNTLDFQTKFASTQLELTVIGPDGRVRFEGAFERETPPRADAVLRRLLGDRATASHVPPRDTSGSTQ